MVKLPRFPTQNGETAAITASIFFTRVNLKDNLVFLAPPLASEDSKSREGRATTAAIARAAGATTKTVRSSWSLGPAASTSVPRRQVFGFRGQEAVRSQYSFELSNVWI